MSDSFDWRLIIFKLGMRIRYGTNEDCNELYKLQIASIKHFCKSCYSSSAINAWVESKSPENYKNLPGYRISIVAVENTQILGFGLLSIQNCHIDNLYVAPNYSGRGYGKGLLQCLEEIAKDYKLNELHLISTLNARGFYHHHGYQGEIKSMHTLSSGVQLPCIKMYKKLKLSRVNFC